MLQIAVVLKSGGDYDWEYVERLYKNIQKHTTQEFKFVVFTDLEQFSTPNDIEIIPLETNLMNYWSKLEIFRLKGQVLYFDLDTIIVNNIDELLTTIESCAENNFYMMEAFNLNRHHSSGVMAWNGDFEFILEHQKTKDEILNYGKWEQDYIVDILEENNFLISTINEYINISSYKKHCLNGVPADTDVVCFHGKPRPKDVNWLIGEKNYE